jgi:hypothetical protein
VRNPLSKERLCSLDNLVTREWRHHFVQHSF